MEASQSQMAWLSSPAAATQPEPLTATTRTGPGLMPAGPRSVCSASPVSTSQTWTVPSAQPVASQRASGLNAADSTVMPCSRRVSSAVPAVTSQERSRPPLSTVSKRRPSARKTAARGGAECGRRMRKEQSRSYHAPRLASSGRRSSSASSSRKPAPLTRSSVSVSHNMPRGTCPFSSRFRPRSRDRRMSRRSARWRCCSRSCRAVTARRHCQPTKARAVRVMAASAPARAATAGRRRAHLTNRSPAPTGRAWIGSCPSQRARSSASASAEL